MATAVPPPHPPPAQQRRLVFFVCVERWSVERARVPLRGGVACVWAGVSRPPRAWACVCRLTFSVAHAGSAHVCVWLGVRARRAARPLLTRRCARPRVCVPASLLCCIQREWRVFDLPTQPHSGLETCTHTPSPFRGARVFSSRARPGSDFDSAPPRAGRARCNASACRPPRRRTPLSVAARRGNNSSARVCMCVAGLEVFDPLFGQRRVTLPPESNCRWAWSMYNSSQF